ncbi:hypothetical protein L1276_000422 [Flavobacterium sp. HSC-32F16]|uniref:hypothetical protein n=1 Tax=Flavobacterium sp. HSC-32F16 TaxID=2910964 RepID=UPI0020A4D523|nr:hypothetical protein [Flavobacterium sp. HSC-32F16]MCP2025282.1 hypothetical protein [Flavobacterium sp. HSC-32F16]
MNRDSYNTTMKPLAFERNSEKAGLKAEVSGTFSGSPLTLTYNFEFDDKKIQSQQIN